MAKSRKVTVKDIAKAAGVSTGTVSNALNNRIGTLSDETRAHVLQAAQDLGYLLKGKRTNVLRLVIYRGNMQVVGDTAFFSELIEGIQHACSNHDYILTIHYVRDIQKDVLGRLDDPAGCDGILFLGTEMDRKQVEACKACRIPFVIVDNAYIDQSVDFVAINNRDAMYEMCMALVEKGHTRIGLINSISQINNFKERKVGFVSAMNDANLLIRPEYEMFVSPETEQAAIDVKNFMLAMLQAREEMPTAYMAVNDLIAFGAAKAFRELNLPMVLTGFDHLPAAAIMDPPLPTVAVSRLYLGSLAVNQLLYRFKHPEYPAGKSLAGTKIVNTEFIKRIN